MSGVDGVEGIPGVEHVLIATPEAVTRAEAKPAKDSPASDSEEGEYPIAARIEAAAVAAGMAEAGVVETPPLITVETTAVGAAERAAKVAAEKLAADTAAAAAAKIAPLDPFQQMMQSSINSLTMMMVALQATLSEAREENVALKSEVFKLKEAAVAATGTATAKWQEG